MKTAIKENETLTLYQQLISNKLVKTRLLVAMPLFSTNNLEATKQLCNDIKNIQGFIATLTVERMKTPPSELAEVIQHLKDNQKYLSKLKKVFTEVYDDMYQSLEVIDECEGNNKAWFQVYKKYSTSEQEQVLKEVFDKSWRA